MQSIIIPFHNEENAVDYVISEVKKEVPKAEIIAIDDGSSDGTRQKISRHEGVRLISFPDRRGQSAALYAGLLEARGEYCVLMDGDGEVDARDIIPLTNLLETADFACGYRRSRSDGFLRKASSWIANSIRRAVLGDCARDTGSIKAIRKQHIRHLVFFDGFHRYIPAFLSGANLIMAEMEVNHRRRISGASKYSIFGRALAGCRDLPRVFVMLRNSHS